MKLYTISLLGQRRQNQQVTPVVFTSWYLLSLIAVSWLLTVILLAKLQRENPYDRQLGKARHLTTLFFFLLIWVIIVLVNLNVVVTLSLSSRGSDRPTAHCSPLHSNAAWEPFKMDWRITCHKNAKVTWMENYWEYLGLETLEWTTSRRGEM